MISTIRIEMLGGLSVWADGEPLLDSSAKINKPWQVFCFLVLNRATPTSAARMIAALWPDEMLSDPGNVLKNTVYALRREFKNVKTAKESPILFENGGYICNPAIHFDVDIETLETNVHTAAEKKGAEKLALLNAAVECYRGDLLPQLDSEMWVMPLALYYKQLFTQSVKAICDILHEEGRHNELLAVATNASRVDPLEESSYTYIFRALYALEMYRAIIPTYHKTARIFSEELGTVPGQEIQDIYAAATEKVDQIEQDIMIIKDDLREVTQDASPVTGPLYCTYDVFKYLYQMVARSSERSGGSVVIVLMTLLGEGGNAPQAKALSAAMNQLKTGLLSGWLRKSDTVARYSKSQYIIMLSVDKVEGAGIVIERIHRKSAAYLSANHMQIAFATTELEPLQ